MNVFRRLLCVVVWFTISNLATAQIPVEVFAGDKKASFDLMFFKYFKNQQGTNSKFLFFSRARTSMDYQMTATTNLPTFGFTEAISYNHEKLKGFAPVLVGQIFNSGVFPKAGIQYAHLTSEWTVFTWAVCETLRQPVVDYFLLVRYTPKLSDKLHLFSQLESFNAFPTEQDAMLTFVQRLRLGLKSGPIQFGLAFDFTQIGNGSFTYTTNSGGFLRYEF